MTAALARRLVWEGVAAPAEATAALRSHVRDRVAFLAALVHAHPNLEGPIELELGLARSALSEALVVHRELWDALPAGLPETLLAIPVGRDPESGAVRVVAAHHGDGHIENEIAFHLGTRVIVEIAPLGTVLAALDGARERSNVRASARAAAPALRVTQSFGSPIAGPSGGAARGSVAPRPSSISPPRAASLPPRPADQPLAGKVRSIPTISIAASAPSSVPPSGEPVISLTRAKSLRPALTTGPTMVFAPHEVPAAPAPHPAESPEPPPVLLTPKAPALKTSQQAKRVQSVFAVTLVDGSPPSQPPAQSPPPVQALATSPVQTPLPSSSPTPPSSQPQSDEPAPSRREIIDAAALDAALDELEAATTPERVVTILVYALENVARRVVVLAARSKAYEGRETNHGPSRNAVRALRVPVDADTALKEAVRAGRFIGPLSAGVANDGLRQVLGDPTEVVVGVVGVQSRPALVYIAAGFDSSKLATRRGEQLALAASVALERIVRERKK